MQTMSLPVILRHEAENDIREIYEYLEKFGQAQEFAMRLRTVLDRLEQNPELHGLVWKNVRAIRLRKFLYVMYYIVYTDRVEVLAIIHGSRNVSVWKSRT
jgi:toxin ParE1/3/4